MLILNFKTYEQSTGNNANNLIKIINDIVLENPEIDDIIYTAPQQIDIRYFVENFKSIRFITQNVDLIGQGSYTGWISPESIISQNIKFSLINHSEHRIDLNILIKNISIIQNKGLNLIVCCENINEAKKILNAKPFAIAFEPKDLIGTGKSVSTERIQDVINFIKLVKKTKTKAFIGAGVSTENDIEAGINLQADGFLLASAFVKAKNPKQKLNELILPFIK